MHPDIVPPPHGTTLRDVLRQRADDAHLPAFTYLSDGDNVSSALSFADLAQAARRLAAKLQQCTQPGDRVLLVYSPGLDYVVAFYACVDAGVVAVPALSPSSARTLPRLQGIIADCLPRMALTSAKILSGLRELRGVASGDHGLQGLTWLATDEPCDADGSVDTWRDPVTCGQDIAFLQYTSGSTGSPKGVMVSHANLLANVEHSQRSYGIQPGDVFVSWLPPHHDFGLIGAIVLPLVAGCHCVQFPPASFLMRPYRWLRLVSDYRARFTGAPNFAFELCVQRISEEQKATLDLSCLKTAVNGAERIRPQTLRRFVEAFGACGLSPETVVPSYGMAESVLLVSAAKGSGLCTQHVDRAALEAGTVREAGATSGLEVVLTGHASNGEHEVAVVDPTTARRLEDGHVGELWIRGPSVAVGYWGREEAENAGVFRARMDGDPGPGWLRSGDLGFLQGGGLYVVGRLKEVMIFNGRNVYPQDIEITVEGLDPTFRANGCAAFSVEDGDSGARLVVVQEIEARRQPTTSALAMRLAAELAEQHEVFELAGIVLVRAGHVPRTSSGKIQRSRCRELFMSGALDAIWSWSRDNEPAPPLQGDEDSPTLARLLDLWRDLLGRPGLGAGDSFFEQGGHSLLATQLLARVRETFHVDLPLVSLFEAPTASALARTIDAARDSGVAALAPVSAHSRGDSAPLSYAQRRFWFLEQYMPGNPFYNIPVVATLGALADAGCLQRALSALVQRHEVLRTVFESKEGRPHQRVLLPFEVDLRIIDIAPDDDGTAWQRADREIAAEAARSFDLGRGPLLRASLLRQHLGPAKLMLTLHHIVCDGASVQLILRELARDHAALLRGEAPAAQALAVQYADYAAWEARRFDGETLQELVGWWRERLAGAPTLLPLSADRPRQVATPRRGAVHLCEVPAAVARDLAALAASHRATLFMAMASALGVLLHRWTGADDLCFGMMSANRPAGTESLVGAFLNVVPLRLRVGADASFLSLLDAAPRDILSAYERQIPFEVMLREVAPAHARDHVPYAQVLINFHNELEATVADDSVATLLSAVGRHPEGVAHAAFDLKLEVNHKGDALALEFEYDTDLYDATTVERLATHYAALLEAVVRQPHVPVGRLMLLEDRERARLAAWNETAQVYEAPARGLHGLFEQQVERTPQATALLCGAQRLSYAELDERTNRLAHFLRERGVGAEVLVAVCMERSVEMVVALLGVLKAGGAYVPIEPEQPDERLAYMLRDARPRLVLTQQALLPRLASAVLEVVCLDRDWRWIEEFPAERPQGTVHPEQLAYGIYTSGSTGQPKGALNPHRGVVNRLQWMQQRYGLKADDVVLQKTPFAFDVSVWEFFWPLMVGATLVMARPGAHKDPASLARALDEHGVTTVHFVPSMLQAFEAAVATRGAGRELRRVFCSGEALPRALQQQFHERHLAVELHNLYGPTEAAVDVTHWACSPQDAGSTVPIGHPVANTTIHVLDAWLQPVPVGVAGELHIGGVQVGRGYLGRPGLTAEKFIPDPYGASGSRMYRTGDLARRRVDGSLEYLGRLDHQVKLRGLRIELGEIENALLGCEGVREAVVVAKPDARGETQLVAYVAPLSVSAAELRQALQAKLPQYMVPGAWVTLETLPLNANGKIDRKALPEATQAVDLASAYEAPRTPTEQALAKLWAQLLQCERVGLHDDFFALGGHSLLATQLVARLRLEQHIELPLVAVFEAPVLAALATHIDSAQQTDTPSIRPRPAGAGPASLSFAQERLWFLDQLDPGQAIYNIPMALQLSGALDEVAMQRSLDALVRRHVVLRTSFKQDDASQIVAVEHAEFEFPLPIDDLRCHADPYGERDRISARLASAPFSLRDGPMLRARLLRMDERQWVLLLTLHHIAADAWSIDVLTREIQLLYAAFAQGRPAPLAPLSVQYADYAAWQRERLGEERMRTQLAFWQAHLAGAPVTLDLPTDRSRPAVQTFRGATFKRELDAHLSGRIDQVATFMGVTPFMLLLGAFDTLLARCTGQSDLVIGTPIANRGQTEIEPLIGLFVNTLALRVDLGGRPSFSEVVARVRVATLGAYANQEVPFEKVVEVLNVPRDLSRSPLVQVMFTVRRSAVPEMGLDGIVVEQLQLDTGTARFDLMLELSPVHGLYRGSWEFNTDLFEAATVERLAGHFETLLSAALDDPAAPIDTLPILAPAEHERIVREWNTTAAPYLQKSVHVLFEDMVHDHPQELAAVDCEAELTYAQLNARANQLARHLEKRGVRPHSLVGLCLDRSLDVAVAVLAILKAGGACVPMDPAYPTERLQFMADDTRAPVIVTHTSLRDRLGKSEATFVCMDASESAWTEPAEDVALSLPLSALCYVIYTSGSTGRPKGASLTHEMLTNLAQWQRTESRLGRGDRTLQFSPLSFDVSFDEMFSTWTSGGTLVMVSEEIRRDPSQLLDWIERHRVARVFIPFVALQGIAEAVSERALPAQLCEIVCGGEQLQVTDAVVALHRRIPGGLLHNQYGPTESHFVTGHRLEGDPGLWPRLPPIGKPLANCRMYILDRRFLPVPPGVRGELYIAGIHLARGYWRRPGLTADRFLPDPHARTPGERMYRTGDIARYMQDGSIEYLGRADHQVKIRGFRIELAEVEQALMGFDEIAAAAATVREDRPGVKRLVGYVVAKLDVTLDVQQLRGRLAERLPDYMVPAAVVQVVSLPQTPSGKIERSALPPPPDDAGAAAYIEPRTPQEQAVARIWSQVLGVNRIGADDNFFELGGHSLLAAKIMSRVRREFAGAPPLRWLFESPTVAQFAARLAAALPSELPRRPPLAPRRALRSEPSFAQERLCFLDRLEAGSAAYNIPLAMLLAGDLHVPALGAAVDALVERHEVLRSMFSFDAEGRVAIDVAAPVSGRMSYEDLSSASDPEAAAQAAAECEALAPIRLDTPPLLRARLLYLGRRRHVLLLTLHHIAGDAWSLGVIAREVSASYEAALHGEVAAPSPMVVQYADYAAWQRECLEGDTLAEKTRFWVEHLTGAVTTLALPIDRPRPASPSFRGRVLSLPLGRTLSERVNERSRAWGATPFMTLLAAYSLLVGRYADQDEVVVGTPVANRELAETEPMVGLFVNTLALRTRWEDSPSFEALVGRVRETTLSAYTHQDMPFEKVVEALRLPRDLSRSPLFQAMFSLQNAASPVLALKGLDIRLLPTRQVAAKFELTLELVPSPADGYTAYWEFNTDLFDQATIERMAESFGHLLQAALETPGRSVNQLPLLAPQARRHLLSTWGGDVAADAVGLLPLPHLFDAQARRTPEAAALRHKGRSWTYRELNAHADQVAASLQARGLGRGARIGVCLERGPELVAALLGILKAGAAYVPMDPAYPRERLHYMLADAGCGFVLAQAETAALLTGAQVQALMMDDAPEIGTAFRPPTLTPEQEAYVLYTSGSTGRPKGVRIGHLALSNFLLSMARRPGLAACDVMLAVTSISFDIAALELYLPLVVGACLELVSREAAVDGRQLAELARRSGASVMQATPATYWLMLAAGWPDGFRPRALVGGEALPEALREALAGHVASLWNMYGPTETTVWSTVHEVGDGPTTIGRPIANTVVRVLDRAGEPSPLGVPGELYIGGLGVALGYVGRPDLTAERFLPDPWGAPGARLYRTGDVVKWSSTGELVYLHRLDHQVKLRGHRIELGEIEARLAAHPEVRLAVAALREDVPGDVRLAAYIVCESAAPDSAQLRKHLARTLPDYMLPSSFTRLESLPLTQNGKVDRKALPAPSAGVAAIVGRPPETGEERILAALWTSLLGLQEVNCDDDFFACGGHSLLAARLVERLRREHGVELLLKDVFESPALGTLALRMTASAGTKSSHAVVLHAAAGAPLFLVHPVGGSVGAYRILVQALPPALGVVGLQAVGLEEREQPLDDLRAMAARYVLEVVALQPTGVLRLAGWSMGGQLAFEMACQLQAAGREVGLLALLDAPTPQETAAWPRSDWPLGEFLADLAAIASLALPTAVTEVAHLVDPGRRDAEALALARASGALPDGLSDAFVHHRARTFMAHREAMRAYRPDAVFDGAPLVLSAGPPQQDGDWTAWCTRVPRVIALSTDHYGIVAAGVPAMCRALSTDNDLTPSLV